MRILLVGCATTVLMLSLCGSLGGSWISAAVSLGLMPLVAVLWHRGRMRGYSSRHAWALALVASLLVFISGVGSWDHRTLGVTGWTLVHFFVWLTYLSLILFTLRLPNRPDNEKSAINTLDIWIINIGLLLFGFICVSSLMQEGYTWPSFFSSIHRAMPPLTYLFLFALFVRVIQREWPAEFFALTLATLLAIVSVGGAVRFGLLHGQIGRARTLQASTPLDLGPSLVKADLMNRGFGFPAFDREIARLRREGFLSAGKADTALHDLADEIMAHARPADRKSELLRDYLTPMPIQNLIESRSYQSLLPELDRVQDVLGASPKREAELYGLFAACGNLDRLLHRYAWAGWPKNVKIRDSKQNNHGASRALWSYFWGMSELEEGNLEQAQACFQEVLGIWQDDSNTLAGLEKIELLRGNIRGAAKYKFLSRSLQPEWVTGNSSPVSSIHEVAWLPLELTPGEWEITLNMRLNTRASLKPSVVIHTNASKEPVAEASMDVGNWRQVSFTRANEDPECLRVLAYIKRKAGGQPDFCRLEMGETTVRHVRRSGE